MEQRARVLCCSCSSCRWWGASWLLPMARLAAQLTHTVEDKTSQAQECSMQHRWGSPAGGRGRGGWYSGAGRTCRETRDSAA